MPFKNYCTLLITLLLVSCQNENKELIVAQQKEAKKREVVFSSIERGWVFDISPLEPTTQAKINNWVEWRNFLTEINQKPKSTIGAFQKKQLFCQKKQWNWS